MNRREFHFSEGTSNKFWAIQLDGTSFTVQYGRLGTSGQSQVKSFATEDTAKRECDKLIAEKVKKGYSEVQASVGQTSQEAKPDPEIDALINEIQALMDEEFPDRPVSNKTKKTGTKRAAPEPGVPTELERSISLTPADRLAVTWVEHQPLPKRTPPPFDLADCLQRLRAIGTTTYTWSNDWRKARVPDFPSVAEAKFWLEASAKCRVGTKTPQDVADEMVNFDPNQEISIDPVLERCRNTSGGPANLFACLAAVVTAEELAGKDLARVTEDFRTYVLPYLTQEQRATIRNIIANSIVPMVPSSKYQPFPANHYIGAMLGCHDEILAAVRHVPDDHYNDGFLYHQSPQLLVFGLANSQLVEAEFRRLKLTVRSKEEARAWLALTEYSALDIIAASAAEATSKDDAAKRASALLLVVAPEAAVSALQISLESKAPHIGQEWLTAHPFHAVVGLVPSAMGQGKLAEAAREYLHTMRRGGQTTLLEGAATHLTPEQSAWLQNEILNSTEELLEDVSRDALPESLRTVLASAKPAKPPPWLPPAALPPIKITGKKLANPEIDILLAALKATPVGTESPLASALKAAADRNALDAFAWKLFDLWLGMGAPSKDKWAMGGIAHLGGDGCVLKLTPLIREWPGESQHQRAVFGIECLRCIGTDTALMALNGIAQKLKFKSLKEKAQAMMEGIAQSRGFTREQLADRIVPDCGLDERGSRIFDFGPRQFRFVLGPEMKPLVRDAAGKVRPDLPAPNSSDDAEKAEPAVAEWKLLKKTLREVLKIQAERLEDAMITGRRWTSEEFDMLLVKHPLMVNLARQLVFAAYDEKGGISQSFRVTEDQTFADQNDDELTLPPGNAIGVVHPAHLEEGVRGAWGQVLSDYEIIPPFQQLGRAICRPDPDDLEKTEITRFAGPKVPGIVMYGMLERSHWLRDTPADGGGFVQHSKHFPSANLTAFIQYDGMSIGYYEEQQELKSVYFVPGHVKPEWWGDHKNRLKIKDVDPVVISEVLRLANAIVSKAA